MALDKFGRNIHYLRISLTDRCNLRCVYCMPEDITFRPRMELMQNDELARLVRLFADLGFDKIRLTGGEPTIRENIVSIVGMIASTPGVKSLSMTTNGVLLPQLAQPLKEAGLQRVNISIDTLDEKEFRKITRWGKLEQVWQGILESERVGLTPVKLNAVIVRGFNESAIAPLARLTYEHNWQIRFIEMMPFGEVADFQQSQIIRAKEMRDVIRAEVGKLSPVTDVARASGVNTMQVAPADEKHVPLLDGEARLYQLQGAKGTLGFISSVTEPFCAHCTRARLTADGRLRLCLLREKEVDLLTPLRQGATQNELQDLILQGIWHKPWGHGLAHNVIPMNRVMSEIGG
ncbi:MAG TPA: GTP 3',8-cyclase MoaA [Anaerolineales bacterium]|nr:GTP 3',8-cyclase MoaA [Anaerolineales bacterium]